MSVLETQWWVMDLPDEWQAEQEEELIVVGDEDGVGEIAITTLEKEEGEVGDDELRQFTQELEREQGAGKPVTLGEMCGYGFVYQEDGDAVREWYLRVDELLVFITYSCDIDNAGMDDAAVDEILSTLMIKSKEESDS